MKRIICFILTLVIILSFGISASAVIEGDFSISMTGDGGSVTGYIGTDKAVVIPEVLSGYAVYAVAEDAFRDIDFITSVSFPNRTKAIGENAFRDCDNLVVLTFGEDLTTIRLNAFNGCPKIKFIYLPKKIETLGGSAFEGCTSLEGVYIEDIDGWFKVSFTNEASNPTYYAKSLYLGEELVKEVTVPKDISLIKSYIFINCESLESITIPKGVSVIGGFAFSGCKSLKNVYFEGSEEDRKKITIGSGNDELLNATWHYNVGDSDGGIGSLDGLNPPPQNDSPDYTLIIIVSAAAAAVILGAVIAAVIIKKKKSK